MKLNPHKRGDSFVLTIELTKEDGSVIDLPMQDLKSEIRAKNNRLISEVEILQTYTPGSYILQVLDTSEWPLGEIYMDVKMREENVKTSTDTLIIPVVRDITKFGDNQ